MRTRNGHAEDELHCWQCGCHSHSANEPSHGGQQLGYDSMPSSQTRAPSHEHHPSPSAACSLQDQITRREGYSIVMRWPRCERKRMLKGMQRQMTEDPASKPSIQCHRSRNAEPPSKSDGNCAAAEVVHADHTTTCRRGGALCIEYWRRARGKDKPSQA